MGGSPEAARKAVETTRRRHGDKFFKERASKAGKASSKFKDLELAKRAGRKGAEARWGKKSTGGEIS